MASVISANSTSVALHAAAEDVNTRAAFDRAFTPPLEGYQAVYPHLVSFFDRKDWTRELVEVAALAVYGWMPRVLKRSVSNVDTVVAMLNADQPPKIEEIDLRFVNDSIVGTSKFLHFRWPEKYPIYDSNIMRCFERSLVLLKNRKSPENYIDFYYAIKEANAPPFLLAHRAKAEARGEIWAEVRSKEMLLFLHGQRVRDAGREPSQETMQIVQDEN
jgi:hypothetical protein